jgi:hypothetical protein
MKSGENRAKDLPGSFVENLHVIAEGDTSAFEFLLTPSACISLCIPFLCLYFGLFFFSFLYFVFRTTSLLSLSRFSLSFFLGQNW